MNISTKRFNLFHAIFLGNSLVKGDRAHMNDPSTLKLFEPICFHKQQLDQFA